MPFIKIIAGILFAVAVATFSLARLAFEIIGASTAPDDFEALKGRMPAVLEWLFTTPWIVPTLLVIAVAVGAAWLLISGTKEATADEIDTHPHLNEAEIVRLIQANLPSPGLSEDEVIKLIGKAKPIPPKVDGDSARLGSKVDELSKRLELVAKPFAAKVFLERLEAIKLEQHTAKRLDTIKAPPEFVEPGYTEPSNNAVEAAIEILAQFGDPADVVKSEMTAAAQAAYANPANYVLKAGETWRDEEHKRRWHVKNAEYSVLIRKVTVLKRRLQSKLHPDEDAIRVAAQMLQSRANTG